MGRLSSLRIPNAVIFVLILSLSFIALGLQKSQQVHAVQPADCGTIVYNRCVNTGYFTNEQRMSDGTPGNQFPWPNWYGYTDANGQPGTWAIPSNVDSNIPSTTAADNFISYTSWALSQPYNFYPSVPVWESCSGCGDYVHEPWDVQRRFVTGAAFVVDTMLGRWGTDYGSGDAGITNGINYARANFNSWADLVRGYAAAGWVDWNFIENQPPHLNTTSVGYGYSARDVNYFHFLSPEVSSLIRFRSPDGSIYRINRLCLNVSGSANLLPPPPPPPATVVLKVSSPPDIPLPGVGGTISIEQGSPIILTWTTGNITSGTCVASINWSGAKPDVSPPGGENHSTDSSTLGTKIYRLDCSGPGGPGFGIVQVNVVAKPYLRVYGGDVMAGASTKDAAGNCTVASGSVNTSAGVIAYNQNSGGYAGAGTQYAAQSYSSIYQFASAALRTSPGPPGGLAFANSGTVTIYGGNFGTAGCATDYWSTNPGGTPTSAASFPSAQLNTSGKYLYKPSGSYISVSGSIPNSRRVIVYIDGDAYIDNNLSFNDANGASWNDIATIPSFYLIVRGDIYIAAGVQTLDGVYVAQPNGATGGHIYTCANIVGGNARAVAAANLSTACNSQLKINGAFIANQVKFSRVKGTLKNAQVGQGADANIAEIFNYQPELWLVDPGFSTGNIKLQSITSLPPIL